ncbi:NAD(P)H-binding protein [Streptomyces sp. 6N223]|uniref:NAD(P)H-binding protein n=1 Tax=Streptomyces sp. 6N223 TaxID=3457412 RepID=UPI003FD10956
MTVVVTGATGTVGGEVARRLVAAGHPVRLLARRPERLRERPELAGPGTEVVTADLDADEPARLAAALAGARSVFLLTNNPLRPEHDERLVTAALAAHEAGGGAAPRVPGPRLVKLSALAVTDPGAQDLITRWHRENEARVTASGLPWTLLRPRAFMSNALSWAPGIRADGTVRAPAGDGRNACVDPRDIAEAAVRALTEDGGPHDGRAYALTGPAAVSPREQTEQLAEVLGQPLRFAELTLRQAGERLRQRYPERVVRALLESAERQRAGGKSEVATGVEEATGRPPAAFLDWAGDHADRFR